MMQKYLLLITDVIIIAASYTISIVLRFRGIVDVVEHQCNTLVFLVICIPVIFYFYDLYKPEQYTQRLRVFFQLVKGWLLSIGLYVLLGFLTKFAFLIESRIFIVSFFLITFTLLFIIRLILMKFLLECCFRLPNGSTCCAYAGPEEYYPLFKKYFTNNTVAGITLTNSHDKQKTVNCKETFLCSKASSYDQLYNEIKVHLDGKKKLHVASPLFRQLKLGWECCVVEAMPVYSFEQRQNHRVRDFVRRGIDIVLSIVGLIVLAPFFMLVAIAIKLDSPGSIIYSQERCGKNGKRFIFYKFRSMREHGKHEQDLENESNHYMVKGVPKVEIVESDYITDIGRIIRKTSIDEWPQFYNILRGDMSLIGPRPHRPHEVKHYQEWHKDRLLVKQGLTGLWQIYGRGEMPCDKSIFLDLIYVVNRSLSLDIKLLFQTIPAVILGKGAY